MSAQTDTRTSYIILCADHITKLIFMHFIFCVCVFHAEGCFVVIVCSFFNLIVVAFYLFLKLQLFSAHLDLGGNDLFFGDVDVS